MAKTKLNNLQNSVWRLFVTANVKLLDRIGEKFSQAYDAKWLRQGLRKRGIRGQIAKRQWRGKKPLGRPIQISTPRFQQERCFAWLQSKYRKLVVRWERLKLCFDAFIHLAIVHIWIDKLVLVG
jgi:Transposase DDE domain